MITGSMTWRQRATVPKASAEKTSGENRQQQSGRSSNHLSVRGTGLWRHFRAAGAPKYLRPLRRQNV
jgi:hypothetical protein